MPQPSGSFGGQVGTGIALVLAILTVALAEDALEYVVAMAPVTARATTRLRTITFMVFAPFFGYSEWAKLDISLDTPDATTLGCIGFQVYENQLHNRISYRRGYQGNIPVEKLLILWGFLTLLADCSHVIRAANRPLDPTKAGISRRKLHPLGDGRCGPLWSICRLGRRGHLQLLWELAFSNGLAGPCAMRKCSG